MRSTYYFYISDYGLTLGIQGEDYSVSILITSDELTKNRSVKSLLHLLMGKIQTQLLIIDDKEVRGNGK